jgi:hypothetical protein
MPYEPARGKTLLIPSGTQNDPNKRHLFVILTDVCAAGQHLLVSLSRIKDGVHFDPACVFEPGEHRFVRDRSFAAYRLARIEPTEKLVRHVEAWDFTPKDDMPAQLVDRMRAGLEVSEFIASRIFKYYQALPH